MSNTRIFPHIVITALVAAIGFFLLSPGPTYAHRDGCHRWHSCPSDSGSYVCGDTGHSNYCSGGSTSQPTQPSPPVQPSPSVSPKQPTPAVNLTASVASDVVNVREEPSITSTIISQVYRNEVVTLIARTSDSEWVQRLDKGWLYRPLLTVNGDIAGISAPSPATFATFRLISPIDGQQTSSPITFKWEWSGTLAADEGFDVQVWKDQNPPAGVAHPSFVISQGNGYYSLLVAELNQPKGYDYQWSVSVVQVSSSIKRSTSSSSTFRLP